MLVEKEVYVIMRSRNYVNSLLFNNLLRLRCVTGSSIMRKIKDKNRVSMSSRHHRWLIKRLGVVRKFDAFAFAMTCLVIYTEFIRRNVCESNEIR